MNDVRLELISGAQVINSCMGLAGRSSCIAVVIAAMADGTIKTVARIADNVFARLTT